MWRGGACKSGGRRCVDALVIDRRWAKAAALNRSSPAAEVHVNVTLAEAERGKRLMGRRKVSDWAHKDAIELRQRPVSACSGVERSNVSQFGEGRVSTYRCKQMQGPTSR